MNQIEDSQTVRRRTQGGGGRGRDRRAGGGDRVGAGGLGADRLRGGAGAAPLGAGLSIWPNGVRALRELGLGELVEAAPRTGGALRRTNGSVLAQFDPAAIEARYGAPLVGLHRADLQRALLAELGAERLRTGMPLRRLEGGELRFADGSVQRADLIVGADGIGSTVRTDLLGDGEPRDSGLVAFRGVAVHAGEVPAGEWWGPGSVAGLLDLGGGRVYWYLAHRGEPDPAALPALLAEYGATLGRSSAPPRWRRFSSTASTTATRSRAGVGAGRRCSATPPTRCCRFSARAPAPPSSTPSPWVRRWRGRTTSVRR